MNSAECELRSSEHGQNDLWHIVWYAKDFAEMKYMNIADMKYKKNMEKTWIDSRNKLYFRNGEYRSRYDYKEKYVNIYISRFICREINRFKMELFCTFFSTYEQVPV